MAHSYEENRMPIVRVIKGLNPQTIIDVGMGAGDYGTLIREAMPKVKLIGTDIWDGNKTDQWGNYNEIIIEDMRTLELPEADIVLFIDSLEHISKEDGWEVLRRTKQDVLLSLPVGYHQPDELAPYDKHLAEWTIEDFKGMEYDDYSNERSVIIILRKENHAKNFNSNTSVGNV